MKLILSILLSLISVTYLPSGSTSTEPNGNEIVYVSTGCQAYAYHGKIECGSIRKCVEEGHVEKWTRDKAISKKRTPCGRCLRKEYNDWKAKGRIPER